MTRLRNWDVGLVVWAKQVLDLPFVWGETDCASLIRRAHRVMYGVDLFREVAPWSSLLGARKAVEAYGGVEDAMRRLGAQALPMAFARQGDVIVQAEALDDDFTGAAFLMVSGRLLSANPDTGVRLFPRSSLSPEARLLRMPG